MAKLSKWDKTNIVLLILPATLLVAVIAFLVNIPRNVNDLWKIESEFLEEKTVIVRGDMIFEPSSDFQFNSIFLVDSTTDDQYRIPEQGFWFGIRIEGVSCTIDTPGDQVTCQPFDPTQATTFEFKGTVHFQQVGKKEIMWLSNVKFEDSQVLIDGKWQPIPLGKFTFPLEKD